MNRNSVIFGFAAALLFTVQALAQEATAPPTPLQPQPEQPRYATMIPPGSNAAAASAPATSAPPLRLGPSPVQPRYATMILPSSDDALMDGAAPAGTPAAAPAQPATVTPPQPAAPAAAPTAPIASNALPAAAERPTPRYAATDNQPPDESVTVSALRSSEDSGYRLGTGDKLRVTVFNEQDLSGDFVIDSLGYVRLPLIGQVRAAGLTTYGLENRVATSMVQGGFLVNPRVNVEVTTYRPFYIIGEVAKPGEYPYVNAMTAQNAVALAGGFTDRAVQSVVYVRHEGELRSREVPVNETTKILPGDVVRVDRTAYWSLMTLLAPLISPFATAAYLLK